MANQQLPPATRNPDGTYTVQGNNGPVTVSAERWQQIRQTYAGTGGISPTSREYYEIPGQQGNVGEDAFKKHWDDVFRSDPEMQRIFAEARTMPGGEGEKEKAATQRAQQLGWVAPSSSWSVDFDDNGFRTEGQSFIRRNRANLIRAGVTFGTMGIGAALAPASVAGSGAGTGAGVGAGTGAGVGAGTGAGVGTGAALPSATIGSGAIGPIAGGTGIGAGTIGGTAATGGVLEGLRRYGQQAGDIGKVATGYSQGAADGRRADASANLQAASINNRAMLDAATFNRDLPAQRASQVARGEVLNTMQDAAPTGDARIDKFGGGGLRPSAFGPQSRAAGAELGRQAMTGLMNPEQDRFKPQIAKPTDASWAENIAGGVGMGASVFDLLSRYGGA